MLGVNVYFFILSGDSFRKAVAQAGANADSSEVFSGIAYAALGDLIEEGRNKRMVEAMDTYSDNLHHHLEYVQSFSIEKDILEDYLNNFCVHESFATAAGHAFLNGWAPYGTAWAALVTAVDEEGTFTFQHSDIRAEI